MPAPHNGKLTAERVRFLFNYNPVTGEMTWRNPTSHNIHVGERVAETPFPNGCRYVAVDRERHLLHRVAWLFVHGSLPDENIKAKNGNYADIRIANLEPQSFADTIRNAKTRSTNTSGVKGVSWDKTKNKWQATITQDYKQVHLGRYDTFEEAVTARKKAEAEGGVRPPDYVTDPALRRHYATQIGRRSRLRQHWKRLIKESSQKMVGWGSFQEFLDEVSAAEDSRQTIAPIDGSKLVGPGNYQWVAVKKVDYIDPKGRLEYNRQHRAQNRDIYKDAELRRDFGISIDQYRQMLEAQQGLCSVCGKPETGIRQGKLLTLAVDHCHATGEIRDLLCGACNKGVGYFRDDPALLRKMADYLERHAERIAKQKAANANVIPLKKPGAS